MSAPKYPDPAPGVTRITQSRLETYLKCGIRYMLEQESRHRKATVRMLVGSGVARGAESDNRAKIKRGDGLTLAEIIEAAVTGYENERAESEVPESKSEQDAGKDETANAARTYALKVSPMVQEVCCAEQPIITSLGGRLELAGTADVITGDGVGDVKTGKSWDELDAYRSRQLTIYGILHKARYGIFPNRLWIDNIYRLPKAGWGHRRIWTIRRRGDYEAVVGIVRRAQAGIEAGVFLPAPEGAWYCSQAWCPHFKECPVMSHQGDSNG